MRAKGEAFGSRAARLLSIGAALILMAGACTSPPPPGPDDDEMGARGRAGEADEIRFTGTVDLVWPGGKGMNAPDDDSYAQASIAAFHEAPAEDPGPGSFTYRVLAADGSLHREIGVKLFWVHVDVDADTVRFLGEVISDTKPCGGSGHGEGGGDHEEGGCSHDDGSHDEGGCSHDDGTTHDDDSHDGGGCSHDDSGTGDDHGAGEPGGPGGSGGHVNGSDCRIGQIVIGWAQDGGIPAVGNDRLSWKWFAPDAPKVLQIQAAIAAGDEIAWPCKLCEKEIIGGNLQSLPK